MKKIMFCMALMMFPGWASAYPASILGGKKMAYGMAHNIGAGWPSVFYEWWNAGRPDWALGAEIVYGDWSGEFSDVKIGLGLNAPFKWQLKETGRVAVGFKIQPGILIASGDAPKGTDDPFIFGMRGEIGVPITIGLHSQVNLITGASVPFTMLIVENADNPFFVIPLLPRIGFEFLPEGTVAFWFLAEVGPTIGISKGKTDVKAGVRASLGGTFW